MLLFALLLLAGTRGVYAAGTPAGTVISSRAVAMYTTASGANVDTVYSPLVVFVVKQAGAVNALFGLSVQRLPATVSMQIILSRFSTRVMEPIDLR